MWYTVHTYKNLYNSIRDGEKIIWAVKWRAKNYDWVILIKAMLVFFSSLTWYCSKMQISAKNTLESGVLRHLNITVVYMYEYVCTVQYKQNLRGVTNNK